MNKLLTCIHIEGKKLFKSKVPLITTLALTLIPFIGGFFMFILKDPELAKRLGFVSTKASLMGTADWPSYINLLTQAISLGGLLVFGFIISWIFGREYSDRTVKDLLALPISRNIIVLSKFTVAMLWSMALSLYVLVLGLIVGRAVDIPHWSFDRALEGISIFLLCSILTILLSTPVGLFASVGRGYLSPLGFMIFTLVLAQIVAVTGYGKFFPWSIPALLSGINGETKEGAQAISIIILLFTSFLGLLGTMLWWRYADQN